MRDETDPNGIVEVDLTSGLFADGFSHGRLSSPIPTTDGLVANGRGPMEAPVWRRWEMCIEGSRGGVDGNVGVISFS